MMKTFHIINDEIKSFKQKNTDIKIFITKYNKVRTGA